MTDLLRPLAAATLVSVCVLGAMPRTSAAQPPATLSDAIPFSADVVVERTSVDRDGVVVARMPKVRYRITERSGPGGATTEVAFHDTPPFPGRGPLQDPSAGFKVVMNEREGISVIDPSGNVVPPGGATPEGAAPTPPAAPAPAPPMRPRPQGASSLGLERSSAGRRQALVARFGSPVGRHGNRERFIRSESDMFEEVLVDPDSALPVEINLLRAGRLVHRSLLTYATLPDGRFYCSSQRDEALADPEDESGPRNVTTTTYTVVTGGGR
jgi:hypothetical protein